MYIFYLLTISMLFVVVVVHGAQKKCSGSGEWVDYSAICPDEISSISAEENAATIKTYLDDIKSRLKDPDSAKFSNVHITSDTLCGFVNAKNSYGGYTGNERFVYHLNVTAIGKHPASFGDDVIGSKIKVNGQWVDADPFVIRCFNAPIIQE